MLKIVICFILLKISFVHCVKELYHSDGDLNVALAVKNCINNSSPYSSQTILTSAIWTTQRLNFLSKLSPLRLGLQVYETCNDDDNYKMFFELYQQHQDGYVLGVVTDKILNDKVMKFSDLLDIRTKIIYRNINYLYKVAVQILNALQWNENVTVIAPEENILNEFHIYTETKEICLKNCHIYRNNCLPTNLNNSGPIVFFGDKNAIEQFASLLNDGGFHSRLNILFIPFDGSVPKDLPENSFVIIPPHEPLLNVTFKSSNINPNPLLFDVASPIINYVDEISEFLKTHCNETLYKMNCIRNKFPRKIRTRYYTLEKIMEILQIEPLKPFFTYDIYEVENNTQNDSIIKNNFILPLNKVFVYNIFEDKLIVIDDRYNVTNDIVEVDKQCVNSFDSNLFRNMYIYNIRTDSWVFAFLSLSLLGITFCLAILIFLLISICRRDVLEGNPVLSVTLLLAVMLLFCSVLPFSLEINKFSMETVCLAKGLSVTLSYALVFSLLLSRCILLATASKEIGFMSHIAGPVQSFLCLFIFGVQAALSLQIVGKCFDIFRGYSFIYLMSYNIMLLLLLLCLSPLIYHCERNYREGKYFSIAIGLIICLWCAWIPCYIILEEDWREPILCFSLVGTAGIFLGVIFIPRTYLMTIAAARDKITSTLPSLGTTTSTLDIYRINAQPIYDCVNVAAINAVHVARAGVAVPAIQQPDLYSCPALPEDDDFDFRCDTPINTDKVTRF